MIVKIVAVVSIVSNVSKVSSLNKKKIQKKKKEKKNSKQHMAVCGLSLHQGSTESCKTLEQTFVFQIGTFNPHGINECFSFN